MQARWPSMPNPLSRTELRVMTLFGTSCSLVILFRAVVDVTLDIAELGTNVLVHVILARWEGRAAEVEAAKATNEQEESYLPRKAAYMRETRAAILVSE